MFLHMFFSSHFLCHRFSAFSLFFLPRCLLFTNWRLRTSFDSPLSLFTRFFTRSDFLFSKKLRCWKDIIRGKKNKKTCNLMLSVRVGRKYVCVCSKFPVCSCVFGVSTCGCYCVCWSFRQIIVISVIREWERKRITFFFFNFTDVAQVFSDWSSSWRLVGGRSSRMRVALQETCRFFVFFLTVINTDRGSGGLVSW